MSIQNSLTLLEEAQSEPMQESGFAPGELVTIARQNAERLQRALAALLDLAAIESGVFRLRLREVDLRRLVEGRIQAHRAALRDQGLQISLQTTEGLGEGNQPRSLLLADPQKLGRAVDLILEIILARGQRGSDLAVRVGRGRVDFSFELNPGAAGKFEEAWKQSLRNFDQGIQRAGGAFAGTLGDEREFLTREEEGLGSEFLLIHEILRMHEGAFRYQAGKPEQLRLEVPEMSSEQGLMTVLSSRAYEASHELSAVALGLMNVPHGQDAESFCAQVQRELFRASDAVYALPSRGQVAIVLDDCKPEDAPRLLGRIQERLGEPLCFGWASCPAEGIDPEHLLALAERRLARSN
jgi:hypothetical protein